MLNLFFRKQFVLSRELLVEDLKVMFFPLILDNKDTMAVQMGTAVPILSKSELCSFLFLGGKREKKGPDCFMVLTTQRTYSKGSIFCI